MQQATVKAINSAIKCSASMMEILSENLKIVSADDDAGELEQINELLKVKQKELVKLAHANKDYTAITNEIDILQEKKQKILVKKAQTEGVKIRIKEMQDFLSGSDQELKEYDEIMVRRYIESIKIFDDKFIVIFKAGNEIEVSR